MLSSIIDKLKRTKGLLIPVGPKNLSLRRTVRENALESVMSPPGVNVLFINYTTGEHLWAHNVITQFQREKYASFLKGDTITTPSHIAVGTKVALSNENPVKFSTLKAERFRTTISSKALQSPEVVRYVTVINAGQASGEIRELGVFDAAEVATVLRTADLIFGVGIGEKWESDGTLTEDQTNAREGDAALQCVLTGDGTETTSFDEWRALEVDAQTYAEATTWLQMWYYVDNVVSIDGASLKVEMYVVAPTNFLVDAMEAVGSWTGAGTIALDNTTFQVGSGSLSSTLTGDDTETQSFNNSSAAILQTRPFVALAETFFDSWYYIADATQLGAGASVKVRAYDTASSYYEWAITPSNGWNQLQLDFSAATTSGTPDLITNGTIVRFELLSTKDNAVSVVENWDDLRIRIQPTTATVDLMEAVGNWTGAGTITLDNVTFKEGAGSLKSTLTGNGTETQSFNNSNAVIKTFIDIDSATTAYFDSWYYIADATQVDGAQVKVRCYTGATDYYEWAFTPVNGWNQLHLQFSAATTSGSPNIVTTNFVERFELLSTKDNTISVVENWDELRLLEKPTTDYYTWRPTTVSGGDISTGWNWLNLKLSDATKTGTPDITADNMKRIRVLSTKDNTVSVTEKIDDVRLMAQSGNLWARVEPPVLITKTQGTVVGVYWFFSMKEGGAEVAFTAYDRETLTISTASLGFTASKYAPTGGSDPARVALVFVRTGNINWTIDGTAPTATTGQGPYNAGSTFVVEGATNIAAFRAIKDSGSPSDATIEIEYLR